MRTLTQAPEAPFIEAQARLLAHYGTNAHSRYLSLQEPALRVHVLEAGAGEPVVLIHGGGAFGAAFEPLLGALQLHFHLFVPDRPGCGLSEKITYRGIALRTHAVSFVRSLLDALELPRAALVGNSMGGYWSIAFALAYPQPVSKLVLIGAPAGIDRWIPPFVRVLGIRGVNSFLYATLAKPSLQGVRDIHQRLLVANIDRLPAVYLAAGYAASTLPGAQESWLTLLEEVLTLRGLHPAYYLREELRDLQPPTCFIWGDKDAFAPPASGEEACKMMSHARLEVVKNAGHLPWLDDPQRCANVLRTFLQSTSGAHEAQGAER